MKFLATLQIFLLLAACMVPEGRHLLSKGDGCTNGCGCSTESRKSGECCCSTKKAIPASPGCSNCKKAESQKSATAKTHAACPTDQLASSCCSSEPSGCCHSSEQDRPTGPQISRCPCGNEVWELQVIMMPRVKTSRIDVMCFSAQPARLCVMDNRSMGQRPQPESPPPQNLPC